MNKKKIIVSTILALVLMVAMATTALAAYKSTTLQLTDTTTKYTSNILALNSHGYVNSYSDSWNNTNFNFQCYNGRWYDYYTEWQYIGAGYSFTTPTWSVDDSLNFRVWIGPWFGQEGAHTLARCYDS